MRTFALCAASALALAAAPALANEAQVEIHSGVAWDNGQAVKGQIGAAGTYDYTLAPRTFVGGEVSVDKTLATGRDTTVALMGRGGVRVTPRDKLYALGGYSFSGGPHGAVAGAGWERALHGPVFGKVEYRHVFSDNHRNDTGFPDSHYRPSNDVLVGAGMRF